MSEHSKRYPWRKIDNEDTIPRAKIDALIEELEKEKHTGINGREFGGPRMYEMLGFNDGIDKCLRYLKKLREG